MKVNPEYLSFTAYQSNNGMLLFVIAGMLFIAGLCLAVWIFSSTKSIGGSVFVFTMGIFISIIAFYGGQGFNQQVEGKLTEHPIGNRCSNHQYR